MHNVGWVRDHVPQSPCKGKETRRTGRGCPTPGLLPAFLLPFLLYLHFLAAGGTCRQCMSKSKFLLAAANTTASRELQFSECLEPAIAACCCSCSCEPEGTREEERKVRKDCPWCIFSMICLWSSKHSLQLSSSVSVLKRILPGLTWSF